MIPVKTPDLIKHYLGGYIWDKPNTDHKIYLTFDDGPIPEVTPWVLKVLKQFNISATFFCVGENVAKYPDIFNLILNEGHSVGNHTYNHLKGWKTSTANYLENIEKAQHEMAKHGASTSLFRPPYGKLTPSQTKALFKQNYEIVMWSVLSKDYLQTISSDKVLDNIISNTISGSIIVCHDNVKAIRNLKAMLPETLETLLERGFIFETL
jgi:peptidoglycan/xylan/chitin deacetylase (PgdA/CDA1 family)